MNLEKIITKNRQLSLKAIGLISYVSIVLGDFEDVNKQILQKELKVGKDALNSAFKELVDADIIEIFYKNNGRFIFRYSVNEFYL